MWQVIRPGDERVKEEERKDAAHTYCYLCDVIRQYTHGWPFISSPTFRPTTLRPIHFVPRSFCPIHLVPFHYAPKWLRPLSFRPIHLCVCETWNLNSIIQLFEAKGVAEGGQVEGEGERSDIGEGAKVRAKGFTRGDCRILEFNFQVWHYWWNSHIWLIQWDKLCRDILCETKWVWNKRQRTKCVGRNERGRSDFGTKWKVTKWTGRNERGTKWMGRNERDEM